MGAAGISKDGFFSCLQRLYIMARVLSVRHMVVVVGEAACGGEGAHADGVSERGSHGGEVEGQEGSGQILWGKKRQLTRASLDGKDGKRKVCWKGVDKGRGTWRGIWPTPVCWRLCHYRSR